MRILVDADACPVKEIIEKVAKEFKVPVVMLIDSSHMLSSDYSQIIMVDQGKDAVDLVLINSAKAGDVVVTQDYGVAALALSKRAYAIGYNGLIYTDQNIDKMLFERHISQKLRRSGGKTCGFKKRTEKDNKRFEEQLRKLLTEILMK